MRIFSLLAALAVSALLYLAIFQRPLLMQTVGIGTAGDTPGAAEQPVQTPAGAADALVKVVVQRETAQDVESAVVLRGETAAARQVDVRAETTAVVASEPLRKGARVAAGDPLCVLDPGTRGATLAEARARQAEARARVPEAEARVAEAEAALQEALINQNAAARLIEDGFASQTRVAAADAAVASARAAVSSAKAGLSAAQSGIEAAVAEVAVAQKEIDRLTIMAPFAGLLETDAAELGSLLQAGGLCATVLQLDPIKLVGFVPETEVGRVEVGAQAVAELAAGGREVAGEVTFLSRSADPSTRTFRVEIEVPNTDLSLRDGQTAEIAIASAGIRAHLVPQSALTLDDDGALGLRTVDDAAVVAFHPVQIIRDTPNGVWVSGLPDTANVIVLGQEYVTAGVTVAPTWREATQ